MLIALKRDWFAPGGVLYKQGTVEYSGPEEELPSDALIVSENGRLPVRENTPKAGFGAKPLEEQVLDLIPGAGVSHQMPVGAPSAPAPKLTEAEREKAEADTETAHKAAEAEKAKQVEADNKVTKKEVAEGLVNAEEAAKLVTKATDPLEAIFDKTTAPKK